MSRLRETCDADLLTLRAAGKIIKTAGQNDIETARSHLYHALEEERMEEITAWMRALRMALNAAPFTDEAIREEAMSALRAIEEKL